jgi:mRNA interferase HigB
LFVRVIARSTLSDFVRNMVARTQQAAVKAHLDVWHERAIKAAWKNSAELKREFGTASILSAERVVFNIKGNDYRLVVLIDYYYQGVLVLWLGTHAEYDNIDAREVRYDKKRYGHSTGSN